MIKSQTKMSSATPVKFDASNARMVELITGFIGSQVVRTFAELSIPDLLAEGSASAADISAELGTDLMATTRLLRAGIALRLVSLDAGAKFSSTELLDTLRADSPESLRGWAIIMGSPGAWEPWGALVDAIKTGKRQTLSRLGMEYFEYLAGAPAEMESFSLGMDGISNAIGANAAHIIDTRSALLAADIGGASGSLLHAVMNANPDLHGIVYERPNVVPFAEATAKRLGFVDRLRVVGGDFLKSVPEADIYLLKWILHDWDDDNCIKILSNCRRSMRSGGRVVVLELQLGEADDPGLTSLMDLNMLVILNGRERTAHEYGMLFAAAGLNMTRVSPMQAPLGPWSIMEASIS